MTIRRGGRRIHAKPTPCRNEGELRFDLDLFSIQYVTAALRTINLRVVAG